MTPAWGLGIHVQRVHFASNQCSNKEHLTRFYPPGQTVQSWSQPHPKTQARVDDEFPEESFDGASIPTCFGVGARTVFNCVKSSSQAAQNVHEQDV